MAHRCLPNPNLDEATQSPENLHQDLQGHILGRKLLFQWYCLKETLCEILKVVPGDYSAFCPSWVWVDQLSFYG